MSVRVSVIIPTYNYAYLIKHAIDSILSQTYHDLELIICDDCSDDNTGKIVKNYHDPRISFYRNETRLGLYGNFNRCGKLAQGEYLLFLCADDALGCQTLEHLVYALDKHSSAAIAVAYQIQMIDEDGQKMGAVLHKLLGPGLVKGSEVLLAQCKFIAPVGIPSHVLIRSSALARENIFDRSVEHCADNALWCSLCEKWDAVFVEAALVYQRSHSHQATYVHKDKLMDIKNDHDMFVRLFQESEVLKNKRWIKYIFVKNTLYRWFKRALVEIERGEWKRGFWILRQIATFSKIPWWVPYFTWINIKGKVGKKLRKSLL